MGGVNVITFHCPGLRCPTVNMSNALIRICFLGVAPFRSEDAIPTEIIVNESDKNSSGEDEVVWV